MWTYNSASGGTLHDVDDVGEGYSGCGAGLNNPARETDADVGPIPRGSYTIGPFFDDPGGKGPVVAHLTPAVTNQMFGRSGFMIHADNAELNHTASHGCIILARVIREQIAKSGDISLEVV